MSWREQDERRDVHGCGVVDVDGGGGVGGDEEGGGGPGPGGFWPGPVVTFIYLEIVDDGQVRVWGEKCVRGRWGR